MVSYQMARSAECFGKRRVQTDARKNKILVLCLFFTILLAILLQKEAR
jgi:hypothetical protein